MTQLPSQQRDMPLPHHRLPLSDLSVVTAAKQSDFLMRLRAPHDTVVSVTPEAVFLTCPNSAERFWHATRQAMGNGAAVVVEGSILREPISGPGLARVVDVVALAGQDAFRIELRRFHSR